MESLKNNIMNDDLMIWVLGADRRLIVLKIMYEKELIKSSDIAKESNRSLQNINNVLKELENKNLVECLTPKKYTWKKFILTEKGKETFLKLRDDRFID